MYLLTLGSGFPVLFIHGMPTNNRLWSGIIARLSGRFTCLAVDLPGLGQTPRIPYGPKHLEALAEQIEEIRVCNNMRSGTWWDMTPAPPWRCTMRTAIRNTWSAWCCSRRRFFRT